MSLKKLAILSRKFGADPAFVLAGGGNTSYKTNNLLYIKPSGVRLADIQAEDFVAVERGKLREVYAYKPCDDVNRREAEVKELINRSVAPESSGRPSVETPLHEILDFTYVFHMHPALVNGMTCSKEGKAACEKLFPQALWMNYVDPGYTLAVQAAKEVEKYQKANGQCPSVVFIQNHGVFVGANSPEEVETIYTEMQDKLMAEYRKKKILLDLQDSTVNLKEVCDLPPKLRSLLGQGERRATVVTLEPFEIAEGPLTPDHIVYAKSFPLKNSNPQEKDIVAFEKKYGYKPLVVTAPGKAVFCAESDYDKARTVATIVKDGALVRQLTKAFGGPKYMTKTQYGFIENWEVESYRKKVSSSIDAGRLAGKIAVVTGGAQGFGLGIAEGLVREGAVTFLADLNYDGAERAANELCSKYGRNKALPLGVNIGDETSVECMVRELVCRCGGVDLFVANAGVLRAGSVKEMERKDWDFVTNINYTGYFLCVKHVSKIMAEQNQCGGWADIVQISSKSGLEGSNRNGAYAGSKFGGIGLTQSFALELVEDNIKVNSVCPGNFYDGPLWSDPKNGLFVQYLKNKKVPGAKTIEDVRKFYENKVPMGRGCTPDDVVRAIIYAVEQKYETGQAIPVTGGQVMLN